MSNDIIRYNELKKKLLNSDLSRAECISAIKELKIIEKKLKERQVIIPDPFDYDDYILPGN